MSVFKVIQQFNYQPPDNAENYDAFSLTCARLTTENEQNKDYVVVTSHSGFISILQPSINEDFAELNTLNQPQIVFETQLNEPILGVLCGNFVQ